jgi:hypothetical protein
LVFSNKSPNQPKEAMSWRKYSKKVKEAIKELNFKENIIKVA